MDTDEFIWKNSLRWSKKYPGKYLAIVDNELVGISRNGHEAFKQAKAKYPDKEVHIDYMPLPKELDLLI